MSNSEQPLNQQELREAVSRVLVKWNMPTRQVAINEILHLHQAALTAFADGVERAIGEDETSRLVQPISPFQTDDGLREEWNKALQRDALRQKLRQALAQLRKDWGLE